MHGLKFTLTPAGVARVHDAVICLSKFSETVSIEARPDKVNQIWSSSSSLINVSLYSFTLVPPAQSHGIELFKIGVCLFLS